MTRFLWRKMSQLNRLELSDTSKIDADVGNFNADTISLNIHCSAGAESRMRCRDVAPTAAAPICWCVAVSRISGFRAAGAGDQGPIRIAQPVWRLCSVRCASRGVGAGAAGKLQRGTRTGAGITAGLQPFRAADPGEVMMFSETNEVSLKQIVQA